MDLTPQERAAEILQRRQEALLAMRFRFFAREGKQIAEAYKNNPPTPRVVWK